MQANSKVNKMKIFRQRRWLNHCSFKPRDGQMFLRRRMKLLLILLFSIILGKSQSINNVVGIYRKLISVFSLYRSLSADDSNRVENEDVKGISMSKENELRVAQMKIKLLEQRIVELENRLPKKYGEVKFLNYQTRKRIMVSVTLLLRWMIDWRKWILQITGGAGFVGSHLVDYLMKQGHEVVVVDNFFTGRKNNVAGEFLLTCQFFIRRRSFWFLFVFLQIG